MLPRFVKPTISVAQKGAKQLSTSAQVSFRSRGQLPFFPGGNQNTFFFFSTLEPEHFV